MLRDVDDDGATPLLLAVGSGRTDIVLHLIERRANINFPNNERVSISFFIAITNRNIKYYILGLSNSLCCKNW